ncbi:protein S40-1-like [Primulina eburnea]|uniref:protein S40-1-like n=1 Tax=Primulina eburnea TaxID=1245227 RepID=UPI003C6C2110
MAEEFQEFEVIFQENLVDKQGVDVAEECIPASAYFSSVESGQLQQRKEEKGNAWFGYTVDGDDGEMVPPHIIIGRRVAGKMMSFSVCTGNGRTLKGRDLSEVRNSILRKTGFLET